MAKKKTVRVVFIDAFNKRLEEHDIKPELEEYYRLLGCDCIESFVRTPKGFDEAAFIYIDEVGGFKDQSRFIVRTEHGNQMLSGNGVLIGEPDEEGEETDCKWSLEDVRKFIGFEPLAQGFGDGGK